MWLDGSDSTTMTFNGTAVSEWRDKSGKGATFTQSIAINQPTFVASARNGRSGLNFAPTLQMGGPVGFSFAQPTTWIVAFQAPNSAGAWTVYDGFSSRQHVFGNLSTEIRMFAGNQPLIATVVPSQWYVAVLVYNGTSSSHRVSTLTASTVNAGTNAITGPRVGSNNGLRGDLGELAMFSRALSDAEATAVLRYLSKKWNVSLS
jgi:hypothetical protein